MSNPVTYCESCRHSISGNCGGHSFFDKEVGKELNPYKCPVCDGSGKVSRPPWVAGDISVWASAGETYPCSACEKGILWK